MGTPKGMRIIMMMGDVSGMMENQNAIAPCGSWITYWAITIDNISGTVNGSMNCCVSASLSTAEPTAAKSAA